MNLFFQKKVAGVPGQPPAAQKTLTFPKPKSKYWQTFALCFAAGVLLFLPHCIIDATLGGGYFHYAGDFNDQQINFYQYANAFIKQGGSFSWGTDLGSGFVNSYSFYLLGSPFFWLSLLLPSRLVPWAMVPLLCLKMALAGGGAYLWCRRWCNRGAWPVLCGVLYACSGFTIYNIFFNHFLDVVALFPYLLASLDDAVMDKKWGRFPFWVALNLVNNYFFFAGQIVFLLLYFFCMLAGKRYKLTWPRFARLFLEALLGCALGCVLLIPAGLSLVHNPRTIAPFDGYGYLVYGSAQQYGAIIYSGFLMPDAPYFRDLFSEGIFKHTSLTAYLPVVGLAGAIVFCRARRHHPFTRLAKICVVCAFVPVLNSAFYALNSSYYARWFYMPVLLLCGMTVMALSSARIAPAQIPRATGLVALVTLSSAAFALVPTTDADGNFQLGVVDFQPRFWALLGVTMLGIVIFVLVWHFAKDKQRFGNILLAAVFCFSIVYGNVHLSFTKYPQWETDSDLIPETYASTAEIEAALPQDEFYRLDAYGAHNNLGLWFDKSCLQFFNSTVAPSIMEFYPTFGVKRDVNSKPEASLYALRGLLSVRYTLVAKDSVQDWQAQDLAGWLPIGETTAYQLYENENWVPMGFTFDHYITPDQLKETPEQNRANLLMRALVLNDEQQEKYADLLKPLPEDARRDYTFATYEQDCAQRRADGVQTFTATTTGFTATCHYGSDELVFFSVPYDNGFTATVNGTPTELEKVDNGLMALRVPGGKSEIVLTYRTPGLAAGAAVAGGAAAIYLGYLGLMYFNRKKKRNIGERTE